MQNLLTTLSRSINERSLRSDLVVASLIVLLNILGGVLVYLTGGTKLSYLHFFYLPIILSGFYFGPIYGALSGMLSAFIVGPYMPESVVTHVYQQSDTWMFRMVFFAGVGAFSGLFASLTKAYLQVLEKQLVTDPVTELPNYRGLMKRIEDLSTLFGVIIIKLRKIGELDKAFGPESTEKIMGVMANSLAQAIESHGIVGRLEAGKFAVLVTNDNTMESVLEDCRKALSQDFKIDGILIYLEFFYGIALREENDTLNDLLRKASSAVDRSIATNINETYYNKELDGRAEKNVAILRSFKEAIEQDALSLNYQPKINIKTGKVVGVEVLSRWQHPQLGNIPPMEYITLAEKTSLINPYTKWMLHKAIAQLALWLKQGYQMTLAVNFSMQNFLDADLIQEVAKLLERYDIPPGFLEIEVTESALSSNITKVADVLRSLRKQHIKIAVDDFGTGLSSLNYLFELPVDVLKIDKVFVQSMLTNSAAEAIVRSVVMLAHELYFEVVAEGIETKEELDLLAKIGCDIAQGYYISRPMAEEAVSPWLEGWRSKSLDRRATR